MKSTKQLLALLIVGVLLISCDKEYSAIGEGLVNETHFNLKVDSDFGIKTTQHVFGSNNLTSNPVQTDNLSYNTLGHYNHPVYGGTTANVLSQVALIEYGKSFGENPVVTRVVLSVPYFSRKISTGDNGVGTYELDSVYGNSTGRINLKMYRSNYFLNEFDINGDNQQYYSNENNITLPGIENQLLFEDDSFYPKKTEVLGDEVDGEKEKLSPRLRVDSDEPMSGLTASDFNWLVETNQSNLSSASNFRNFYRGIYFKATSISPDGVLFALDLSQAEIEIFHGNYRLADDGMTIAEDDDGNQIIDDAGSVKMLFSGTRVNTFENDYAYTDNPNVCYLNGGQGAMVGVELFSGVDTDGDGISDELEELRNRDLLINEASLEFYVDQSINMGGESEPERLFLYDLENNKVLLDYQFDNTSENDTNLTQLNHLGKLERNASGLGTKYKLRITEHITDLVRNDSTNVKLGLAVTNNVLALGVSDLKSPIIVGGDDELSSNSENDDIKTIFSASVNSHKGTVLYSEDAIDPEKRIKLTIHYTEEN